VWAQDDRGTQTNAVAFADASTFFDQFVQIGNQRRYRIGGLVPGGYFVKVQARNAPTASVRATAIAKSSVLVDVGLKPSPDPCPPRWELEKPVDKVKADQFTKMIDSAGNRYGSVTVMHDYRTNATAIPQAYAKPQQMQFSQSQVAELVSRWRCRLTWNPIEEVVTELEPEVWIKPGYDPDVYPPPGDPYAYLKIDDYAYPVILTAEDRTLPVTMPATEARIPETSIDRYVNVLGPMGLGDLDVLAGAWGGLLKEALGVPAEAVGNVAQELGNTAAAALEQKLYFPGVSAEIGTALKEAEWTDVKIANASVAEMSNALESLEGVELSHDAAAGLASRLVGVARTIVPAEAWSLEDESIGLDSGALESLRASGVETKGGLAAASQETLATVAEATGVTTAVITEAQAKSEVATQAIDIALTSSPALTDVGLSKEQAGTLAEHGVTTVAELLTADVDLTSVLALDEEQATAIKGNATTAVTATWGSVATKEGVNFQQSLGSLGNTSFFSSVNNVFKGGIG
jgi:hypothetical protein